MDWIIYATAAILHVWCVYFAAVFIYAAIVEPEIAGSLIEKPRFLAPFIGLVFFYSWVLFG